MKLLFLWITMVQNISEIKVLNAPLIMRNNSLKMYAYSAENYLYILIFFKIIQNFITKHIINRTLYDIESKY